MPAAFVIQEREPKERQSAVGRGLTEFSKGITSGFKEKQRRKERQEKLGLETRQVDLQEQQVRNTQEALNFRMRQQRQETSAKQLQSLMKFRKSNPGAFRDAMFQEDGQLSQRGERVATMILASQGVFVADGEDLNAENFAGTVLASPAVLTDEENQEVFGFLQEFKESVNATEGIALDDKAEFTLAVAEVGKRADLLRSRGVPLDRVAKETTRLLDELLKFSPLGFKKEKRRSRLAAAIRGEDF